MLPFIGGRSVTPFGREWKKRGVRGQAGVASRPSGLGNREYQRSEGVLQAVFKHRQPDLE
jgi:hypothetical protein